MANNHYTLTSEDVGKQHLRAFGRLWPVSGFIGQILKQDVGKRVYLRGRTTDNIFFVTGAFLQVENEEQRASRVAIEASPS